MKKVYGSMVAFIFAAMALTGCGGGGSSSTIPTVTGVTTSGSLTVTAAQNAGANVIVDDFANTGWKILLPAGTLAANTTFVFASLNPGSGGVPAVPSDRFFGFSAEITATPVIPSGKSVTIMYDASDNTDIATGNTVDLMKVVSGVWTDVGTATKYSDGSLRGTVTGFSQLSLGVRDGYGTYNETFTIVSSTNPDYCGSVGSIDNSDNVIAQEGVVMTFNPADPECDTTGKMQANGAFAGAITCTVVQFGCTVATTGTFTGTLDISASPKEYSATVFQTSTFSGTCNDAPTSCAMSGMVQGVLRQ